MQDVRRGMSDFDLVVECPRLENLAEMSRCEEMRLGSVRNIPTPSRVAGQWLAVRFR